MIAHAILVYLLTAGSAIATSALHEPPEASWPVYRMTQIPCGPDEGCAFRLVPVPITSATEERPELL